MTGRTIDVTGDPWIVAFPFSTALNTAVSAAPGARWHGRSATWQIPPSDPAAAVLAALADEHDFTVTGDLEPGDDLVAMSSILTSDLRVEGLRLDLFDHQNGGVEYLSRVRRSFVVDEMGLGKTYTALATAHHLGTYPIVVAAPRKLRSNWAVEAKALLPVDTRVAVVVSPSTPAEEIERIHAHGVVVQDRPRRGAHVYVVSYSTIANCVDDLIAVRPRALILDESQTCKTRDRIEVCARCAQPVLRQGHCRNGHKAAHVGTERVYRVLATRSAKALSLTIPDDGLVLALSGTPNKNTTSDLIAQLDIIGRLDEFGGEQAMLARYCGTDGRGGTNLLELHHRLRSRCMLRRTKAEVLPHLPPIIRPRVIVDLEPADRIDYDRAARDFGAVAARRAAELAAREGIDPGTAAFEARARAEAGQHLTRIGTLLRLAAMAKVPFAIEWAQQFLAETDRKLVVFAYYHDVIDALAAALGAPIIDGRTGDPMPVKDRFQTDPACRVVVVGITSGGVGLTLTAASDMLFVEQWWTPGDLDQAESRCYGRINDAHGATATYLTADGTIDDYRWNLVDRKATNAAKTVDGSARHRAQQDLVAAMLTAASMPSS